MKKRLLPLLAATLSLYATDPDYAPKLTKQEAMEKLQSSMQLLDNEMKQAIGKLSKETKGKLIQIYRHHDRHSQQATLRQVMHEVTKEYETMASAIFMENGEMAADAARRLANHRIPRGGLIAYLKPEQVNDNLLTGLDNFNASVEGNAIKFAQAAERGDFATAASLLSPIANGCIACHQVFRDKPGISPHVK